jgi:ABC-type cobalamin/Fe3+-siderophores transport system ATPase subunit
MLIDIVVKNYRCFADSDPLRFQLRKGFTGLLGTNNSGKSTILKFFYEFRGLFSVLSNGAHPFEQVFGGVVTGFPPPSNILDFQELFWNEGSRDIEMQFRFSPEPGDLDPREYTVKVIVIRGTNTFHFELFQQDRSIKQLTYDGNTKRVYQGGMANTIADISFVFEAFAKLSNTLYVGPFRNAVNIGTGSSYFDTSIGQTFISTWRFNKTGPRKSSHQSILRLTEDVRRIFGFKTLEINASDDNQAMHLFIDGKSYSLSELGSGISQFILVLAAAALKSPSYILIDEPEMGLHPSLQMEFLTTLGNYAQEGLIFSTHSIGLAKASADRVYSLRKTRNRNCEARQIELTSRLSELSGELSYAGYQELGFEKILLVEGVTEVKVFQQLLQKYGLNHKVVIMPLGGRQLITGKRELELQELKRISENLFAVIDSERAAHGAVLSAERQGFVDTCKVVKISCLVLKFRATENYLTDRAVKVFKGTKFAALGPYQSLADVTPSWGKEENWRIAREMTRDEIDSTDLGEFLRAM